MKHIISFFARKPSESQEDLGLSFVRLQAHEGALSGPLPLAVNYLARTKLKIRDLHQSHANKSETRAAEPSAPAISLMGAGLIS